MVLKAIFPSGQTEITVNGLHQWDYGQQLEIESLDLPAMVEVHFACVGMQTAEVRTCSAVSGKLVVAIPDLCLEQSAPIIAWVFAINGEEGTTVKTITLPIIPRTRPQVAAGVPRDNADAYTQFLTEVNKAVGSLKEGDTVVARALSADRAQAASHADTAAKASYTDHAGYAESASLAVYADNAGNAEMADKAKQMEIVRRLTPNSKITMPGLYLVVYRDKSQTNIEECELLNITYLSNTAYGAMGAVPTESNGWVHKGPAYNPDRTNMTNTITLMNMPGYEISTIWLLAAYDIDQ